MSRAFETKGFCCCVLFLKVEECNVARVLCIIVYFLSYRFDKAFSLQSKVSDAYQCVHRI